MYLVFKCMRSVPGISCQDWWNNCQSMDMTMMWTVCVMACLSCWCQPGEAWMEPLQFTTVEEQPAGTLVGSATEQLTSQPPAASDTPLRFSLIQIQPDPPHNRSLFSVDELSGEIHTGEKIDRDVLCPEALHCAYTLDIMVMPVEYFQIIKVTVDVLDINDNMPVFVSGNSYLSLSEAAVVGTSVALPAAVDPDGPLNGIRHYSLTTTSDTFEIVASTSPGNDDEYLRLKRGLDREQREGYTLEVVAVDGGDPPRSSAPLTLNITITDINDNPPVFLQPLYDVQVEENIHQFPHYLTQVRAVDADLDSDLRYALADHSSTTHGDVIHVDSVSGDIWLVGPLDYESTPTMTLTVVVKDDLHNAQSSQTIIQIQVLDSNDNAPVIRVNTGAQDAGDVSVAEGLPPNTFLAHVAVTDADSGDNGRTDCHLDLTHLFKLVQIYQFEYKLETNGVYDREEQSDYAVVLTCTDSSTVPLTTSVTINVTITDVNDNVPHFQHAQQTLQISENTEFFRYKLNVTDPDMDQNAALTYSLQNESELPFSMDTSEGIIKTGVLDYEAGAAYDLVITVQDGGIPSFTATSTLHVDVTDVNDEKPIFVDIKQTTFHVPENEPPGIGLVTLTARDNDSTPFNEFTFSLGRIEGGESSMESTRPFIIQPDTGRLTTGRSLDRETDGPEITVEVFVIDNNNASLFSSTFISVVITDVNDNAPQFIFPNQPNDNIELSDTVTLGEVIVRCSATDADEDQNAELVFSLTHTTPDEELFAIDPRSCQISLLKTPELVTGTYNLTIKVSDDGQVPLTTETNLYVIMNSTEFVHPHGSLLPTLLGIASALIAVPLIVIIVVVVRRMKNDRIKFGRKTATVGHTDVASEKTGDEGYHKENHENHTAYIKAEAGALSVAIQHKKLQLESQPDILLPPTMFASERYDASAPSGQETKDVMSNFNNNDNVMRKPAMEMEEQDNVSTLSLTDSSSNGADSGRGSLSPGRESPTLSPAKHTITNEQITTKVPMTAGQDRLHLASTMYREQPLHPYQLHPHPLASHVTEDESQPASDRHYNDSHHGPNKATNKKLGMPSDQCLYKTDGSPGCELSASFAVNISQILVDKYSYITGQLKISDTKTQPRSKRIIREIQV